MKFPVSILLILILGVAAFGQNKLTTAERVAETNRQMKPIDEYVKTVDDFVESQSDPHLIIADISDYNEQSKALWARFDSREAFENDGHDSYTVAYIWLKDDKIVQVNFTYSSPSGDWVHYVFHTYYPNGVLAKGYRDLRTFMDDIIVTRVQFLNNNGRTVKFTRSFNDLLTKEPATEPVDFMDIEADVYLNVKDLPFQKLLLKKKRANV